MSTKRADAQRVLDAMGGIDEELIEETAAFRKAGEEGAGASSAAAPKKSGKVKAFRRALMVGIPVLAAAAIAVAVLMNGGLSNLSHNASSESAAPKSSESRKAEKSEESASFDMDSTGGLSEEIAAQAEEAIEDAGMGDEAMAEAETATAEAAMEPMEAPEAAEDAEADEAALLGTDGYTENSEGSKTYSGSADEQLPVVVMPEAQVLRIYGDGTKLNYAPGAQEWVYYNVDGELIARNVDAPSADDPDAPFLSIPLSDGYAVKDKNAAAFVLAFPLPAEKITVCEWKQDAAGAWSLAGEVSPETESFSEEGDSWILHRGCRYEVVASWGNDALQNYGGFGEASYIFEVE